MMRKRLCGITLWFLKAIPMVIALIYLLNTILSYFDVELYFLSMLGGLSILPWLFLYLASFVFRLCEYHRMFLYYIASCDIISYIDYTWGIPVPSKDYLVIHLVVAGIFLFLILYLKFRVCRH